MFNKLWLRTVMLTFATFFLIVTATLAGIFSFLYFQKDSDYDELLVEKTNLEKGLGDEEDQGEVKEGVEGEEDENHPHILTFEDIGQEISAEYNDTWEFYLETNSAGFATDEAEDMAGQIINKYDLVFKKDKANLEVSKILFPTGFYPSGVDSDKQDYVELGNDLIRYNDAKNSADWTYGSIVDCPTDDVFEIEPGSDVCVSQPLPNLDSAFLTTISTSNANILKEADEIIKSIVE